jgi:uncharacterized protein
MDYVVVSRAAPRAAEMVGDELTERHWSYMDGFADQMTARGPTLGTDRLTWTGSFHIVDLPDRHAAGEFVAREPYNKAGLFAEHAVWRFADLLGRTMWQFDGAADEPRFLVLARTVKGAPGCLTPVPLSDLSGELRRRLIVYGELRDPETDEPGGLALALQVAARETLDMLLGGSSGPLHDYGDVAVHDWEFGGRR